MKRSHLLVGLGILGMAARMMAGDSFPDFSKAQIKITIPTNLPGYEPSPGSEAGRNAVYTINGQIFTNAAAGHIQTTAEGFSGTTDKRTPWKTLTELLAVYQQGCDEKKIRALYTASSQPFLDEVFSKPDNAARLRDYGKSIKGMQVVLGFDLKNGYMVNVNVNDTDSPDDLTPFYFVQTNGVYLLSQFNDDDPRTANIAVFLGSHPAKDLLQ